MYKDRHARVEITCEICGNPKMVRTERVEQGMGRYCSKGCSHEGRRRQEQLKWGRKDLARKYKTGNKYVARWYDENGKTCSTTYGKWWWEMNNGEIPDGMVVMHKDNNPLNISPSNFVLGTYKEMTDKGKATLRSDPEKWKEYLEKNRKRQTGFKHTPQSKAKISKIHRGRKLTIEQKNKMSKALAKRWRDGGFDDVHKGKSNRFYKENKTKHPKEFDKSLKKFIRSRDNEVCQICGEDLENKPRRGVVHHIDGIKSNNESENLILICQSCHAKIHFSKGKTSPVIVTFRDKLLQ